MSIATKTLFGQQLIEEGLISEAQLQAALIQKEETGKKIGDVLVDMGVLSDHDMTKSLGRYLKVEYYDAEDFTKIDVELARLLPENIARRLNLAIVFEDDNKKIIVAMCDPLNVVAIDTVTMKLRKSVNAVICPASQIAKLHDYIYQGSDLEQQALVDLVGQDNEVDIVDDELNDGDDDNENEANLAPVVRFVDLLLSQAVKSRASDIHIEPQDKGMKIRMRIDGVLRFMIPPSRAMQGAVVTRIKILAKLDISEKRLPQDGRFKIKTRRSEIDMRISILPTIYGEKVVMRILDASGVDFDINKIGFGDYNLPKFKKVLKQPHGIVVVTGPTGSGKSTTLYGALTYLVDPAINIVTIENPVEYRLEGITQVQVRPEIDLTFAAALRSMLRQDPDIILVGEVRDKETIEIAIEASLTGHMVLTTFHSNDAPSTITRMLQMGVEPYLLASSLNMIMAQRLVRKICEHCKQPIDLSDVLIDRLGIEQNIIDTTTFYQGEGCAHCSKIGYAGRLAIFEFLFMNYDIRELVSSKEKESIIRAAARKNGDSGLRECGVAKMIEGMTTGEEVLKVSHDD